MIRIVHTMAILATLIAAAVCMHAQTTSIRLRDTIDQCRDVKILDRELPVDSLRVTPALSARVVKAFLLCMTSTFPVDDDTTSVTISGDVGRLLPITILRSDSMLTVIESKDLDAQFLTNTYQLITPLVADTIIVDSFLTTRPWNGASGGVIILEARHTMQLTGTIDLSGLGYSGGARSANGGSCGVVQACDPPLSGRTGGKGLSPLRQDPACASGHRPWASGGGGGDAHNAGGGGGGNAGRGGRGGDQYRCSDPIGMYGVGGLRMFDPEQQRLIAGSGGGGGHQNNSVATDGAAGGGIIILRAPRIIGDSVRISARGRDVNTAAGNDGAGGGGGGGSVCIEACSTSCRILVDVSGGRGGTAVAGHGPGGGGGGGRFLALPALLQDSRNLRIRADGGAAGTITNQPNDRNGARQGDPGLITPICDDVVAHNIRVPGSASVGDTLSIAITARDTSSLCECLISHTVRLAGAGVGPLSSGMQLVGLSSLITSTGNGTITFDVQAPSRSSLTIPFLCVLSMDTTIQAITESTIRSTLGATLCELDEDTTLIAVDVCGRSRRQVVVSAPFRMKSHTSPTRQVAIELESATSAQGIIRVYDVLGNVLAEHVIAWTSWPNASNSCSMIFDGAAWPPGTYLIAAHTIQGTRTISIRL